MLLTLLFTLTWPAGAARLIDDLRAWGRGGLYDAQSDTIVVDGPLHVELDRYDEVERELAARFIRGEAVAEPNGPRYRRARDAVVTFRLSSVGCAESFD